MSLVKDSYTSMIIFFQIVEIPKSQNLFALAVIEVVSAFAGELNYLVGSLLILAELSVR